MLHHFAVVATVEHAQNGLVALRVDGLRPLTSDSDVDTPAAQLLPQFVQQQVGQLCDKRAIQCLHNGIVQFVTLRAGYRSLFNHSSLAYGLGLAATGPKRDFFGLSGAADSGVVGFGASRTST